MCSLLDHSLSHIRHVSGGCKGIFKELTLQLWYFHASIPEGGSTVTTACGKKLKSAGLKVKAFARNVKANGREQGTR